MLYAVYSERQGGEHMANRTKRLGCAIGTTNGSLLIQYSIYNRVTYEMKLSPFTLQECEEYYIDNQIRFSR